MKTTIISAALMTFSLGSLSARIAIPQHEGHSTMKGPEQTAAQDKKGMSHDHMMMAHEPHHVLAMAYHQNLAVFARALHEQTARDSSVNVEFSRAAVTEMRRSFDLMKQHHQSHMQTMSAEMHTKMSGMMQQMETHQAELNTQLTALEQEIKLPKPDAKKVSALAASVHSHLDAMSKKHQGSKMKMKM